MIKHSKECGNGRRKGGGRRRKTLSPGRVKSFFLADIEVIASAANASWGGVPTYFKFGCMFAFEAHIQVFCISAF